MPLPVLILLLSLPALLFILLVLILPGRRNPPEWLKDSRFAHRGKIVLRPDTPENTLKAFDMCIRHGSAIEFDVRLDGAQNPVVFHDPDLLRLCSSPTKVSHLTDEERHRIRIGTSDQVIPLLTDVLERVAGQVPLLIEIKPTSNTRETCSRTWSILKHYSGPYILQSFDARVLSWFRRHAPDVFRGQLTARGLNRTGWARVLWFPIRYLLGNVIARPHFISGTLDDVRNPARRLCRAAGATLIGWVAESPEACTEALRTFDAVVYQGTGPDILDCD